MPSYVDRILAHSPRPSQETLSRVLILIANNSTANYESIKKLIDAGASTQNVSLPNVLFGNDFDCKSVFLLLNNNLPLYKNKYALNTKPKSARGRRFRREDLAYLADTITGRSLCDKSIKKLVSYNPSLRDIQITYDGSTALHKYLEDTSHPDWKLSIAKFLITKINVNYRKYDNGNTPLHTLILLNRPGKNDFQIIKAMINAGANLALKNKYYYEEGKQVRGISVKDLILKKRPDLIKYSTPRNYTVFQKILFRFSLK